MQISRIFLVVGMVAHITQAQIEAEYLRKTIGELKKITLKSTRQNTYLQRISHRFSTPDITSEAVPIMAETTSQETVPIRRTFMQEQNVEASASATVPALQLTKSELAALYKSALSKGETISLGPENGASHEISAVVHELGAPTHLNSKTTDYKKDAGYYYYYYPLKSFMDELSSSNYQHEPLKFDTPYYQDPSYLHHHHHTTLKPYTHSHMHQHNVHFQPVKHHLVDLEHEKKNSALEPLFMAISGFIGMTVMFILSVLVLPKFDKLKPKGFKEETGASSLSSIARLALQALEGMDCGERFACEAAKTAKTYSLFDNRVVKLIRRLTPGVLTDEMSKVDKYSSAKYKCATIKCKDPTPAEAESPDEGSKRAMIRSRESKIMRLN